MFSKQNSLKIMDSLNPTIEELPSMEIKELDFRYNKLEKLLHKFKSMAKNEEIFKDCFVDKEYFDELASKKDYPQLLECLLSYVTHSSRPLDSKS